MKRSNYIIYIICLTLLLSCNPLKRHQYFKDTSADKRTEFKIKERTELKIKKGDELLIKVSSFDDINFNYFEAQSRTGSLQATSELSLSAIAYSVNEKGNIQFPIIGDIQVENLTIAEASDKVKLKLEPYFDQPNVNMKFAYKKITVLGEVNRPGYYTYSKGRLNIFEALGLANDITIHGDKRNVILIRTVDNITNKYKLDLTNKSIFEENLYYLLPDDIIYIKTRNSIKRRDITSSISLILTGISTLLLVLDFI